MPWRILAKIETADNFDNCLSVYVKPKFSNERLIQDPINSILKFRILKTGSNQVLKEASILAHYEAEDNVSCGIDNFITVKKIFNECNDLYDSNTLEVLVEIVEKFLKLFFEINFGFNF